MLAAKQLMLEGGSTSLRVKSDERQQRQKSGSVSPKLKRGGKKLVGGNRHTIKRSDYRSISVKKDHLARNLSERRAVE